MPYASIAVHVDRTSQSDRRARFAVRVAAQQQAHLVGIAPTGVLHLPAEVRQALGRDYIQTRVAQLREEARAWLDAFEAQVRNGGARGFESRVSSGGAEEALLLHGRYSDVVVLSRPEIDNGESGLDYDQVGLLTLGMGRPVVLVPGSW